MTISWRINEDGSKECKCNACKAHDWWKQCNACICAQHGAYESNTSKWEKRSSQHRVIVYSVKTGVSPTRKKMRYAVPPTGIFPNGKCPNMHKFLTVSKRVSLVNAISPLHDRSIITVTISNPSSRRFCTSLNHVCHTITTTLARRHNFP